ncbi:MAG: hypothetical protein RLZ25_663 [Pseudomonadota bacterium]|jgi:hypothetical protein
MKKQQPAAPRPKLEPVSSAMQCPGLWRLITDGNESLAELIVCADRGPDAIERGIQTAIHDGWPMLMVLPAIVPDGYLCNPY